MRQTLGIFLITLSVFLVTGSGHLDVMDEYVIFFQGESAAQSATIAVPQAEKFGVWYGRRAQDGAPHGPYGPAHAAATAPFHKAADSIVAAANQPRPPKDLLATTVVLASSAVFAALLVAGFYLLCRRLGATFQIARWLALGLAFSTPVWVYAGKLYSEAWTMMLFIGAALALERATRKAEVSYTWTAVCGVILGLTILTRMPHAIAAPVFGAALIFARGTFARRRNAFLLLGLVTASFFGAYLYYNYLRFGDAFQLGYPDGVEGGKVLTEFTTPLVRGLTGFLLSPGKSLFLFVPLAGLALVGLPLLWKSHRSIAIVSVGCMAAYLLTYCTQVQWEGGFCWGPRYLLPVMPLLLLPMARLMRKQGRWLRPVLILVVGTGFAVQLPAVCTSDFEAQFRAGGYYDENKDYQLGFSAVTAQWQFAGKTAGAALAGKALRGDPSQGLDFWFITLRKEGHSWLSLLMVIGGQMALLGIGLFLFRAPPVIYEPPSTYAAPDEIYVPLSERMGTEPEREKVVG